MLDLDFWKQRRVFLTGHTGFKGGWLATWLLKLGARVTGYALKPETDPSFFTLCGLEKRMESVIGDIREEESLGRAMERFRPEVVFHLAAQSLVRRSYRNPVQTFATNLMGTVHLLEAVRRTPSVLAAVVVTSDKCYENREWMRGYREEDPVGGHDPYSASKGCAELAAAAYRRSFFTNDGSPGSIATARAGNVIGGGDWAEDRLVPDAIRAVHRGEPLIVRNPGALRPWQHVLEPVAGYLMLAERLYKQGGKWAGAWNFGPREEDVVTVGSLSDMLVKRWGNATWKAAPEADAPHEARCLKLDSSQARQTLGWQPRLTLSETVEMTVDWYRKALSWAPDDGLYEMTCDQINGYEERAPSRIKQGSVS